MSDSPMSDSSTTDAGGDDEIEAIRQRKLEKLREKAERGESGEESERNAETATTPDSPIHFEGGSFSELIGEHELALVDFHADWCGPCRMMEPILESIAESAEVAVIKVDADVHQELTQRFGVRGLPTLILFQNGEPAERLVGAQQEPQLRSVIERHRPSEA